MNVTIVGAGHVGLVTGACLAEIGNDVVCVDNDERKIEMITKGVMPIYEPGLPELVARNMQNGRLRVTTSMEEGVRHGLVIFVAVGTPPKPDGEADLSYIEAVAREVARHMDGYRVISEKSTVPVQTGQWVERTIRLNNRQNVEFDVVSNPEFLREGAAIFDFMYPDRIVVGAGSPRAAEIMQELYQPIISRSFPGCTFSLAEDGPAPFVVTDVRSAELIKHASNSFLAMKISFINAVAAVCELSGADVTMVAKGMGYDRRIGPEFLHAGAGYGGSCFPKDVAAFRKISASLGYEFKLLDEVGRINQEQRRMVVQKIKKALWIIRGKTIGVLGLSFKPDTDDMREAPSVDIIKALQADGAHVRAYDPHAIPEAAHYLEDVEFCDDPYAVARDADTLLVMTEWSAFTRLDMERVKGSMNYPILVDARNMLDPAAMRAIGFEYFSIGRP
ncbi:UDP-glucose/GDP-mannose dehydrogenase family protein [Candidatus Fermentibacteria bacterium]|nr:UDP-glucose/GDP-mannose dehydrogenase family protein [Candidatus Fermentibacteria bacterium]